MRRWVYICTYNKASNDPIIDHHHPRYTPLVKVGKSLIPCMTFATFELLLVLVFYLNHNIFVATVIFLLLFYALLGS